MAFFTGFKKPYPKVVDMQCAMAYDRDFRHFVDELMEMCMEYEIKPDDLKEAFKKVEIDMTDEEYNFFYHAYKYEWDHPFDLTDKYEPVRFVLEKDPDKDKK